MSVPDVGRLSPGGDVGLQFVMRDVGNGVQRLEQVAVEPMGQLAETRDQPNTCVYDGTVPAVVMDLAETALLVLRDRALGYVLSAPVRGFATYVSEGVTKVTLKLVSVVGEAPLELATMLA